MTSGADYRRLGYLVGLAAGVWIALAGSYLALAAITQRGRLLGVLASLLSGLVFIRAAMLVKRGKAKTGGSFLTLFAMVNLIWSLRLWASVGTMALIIAIPSLLVVIVGLLIYTRR